jgi:hypothetical protein
MSETKEVVSGVIEDEGAAKDGELTDADLEQVSGGANNLQYVEAINSYSASEPRK